MTHLLPRFKRALTRYPASNFASGITEAAHLGAPDHERALRQYENYLKALRDCGLQVRTLDADVRFPDGHFVEDPFVIFRDLAFRCRSAVPARDGEAESLEHALEDLRIVRAPANAHIDGGDVLICHDRVLVGLSRRTNAAGVKALADALRGVLPDIRVEAVPFSGVLHLKSGLTEIAPGLLLHDPALKTAHDLAWARVITVPPEEGFAADAMPVNETLFIAAGCPVALREASRFHPKVAPLDMSEFRKMDGGLTCLSLRY